MEEVVVWAYDSRHSVPGFRVEGQDRGVEEEVDVLEDARRSHHHAPLCRQRDFFINNLLVRIQFIIETILVDRPGAIEV